MPPPLGTRPNPPSSGKVALPSPLVPVCPPPLSVWVPWAPLGVPGPSSLVVGDSPARAPLTPSALRPFYSLLVGYSVPPDVVVPLVVLSDHLPRFPPLVRRTTPWGAVLVPANWVESVRPKKSIGLNLPLPRGFSGNLPAPAGLLPPPWCQARR